MQEILSTVLDKDLICRPHTYIYIYPEADVYISQLRPLDLPPRAVKLSP